MTSNLRATMHHLPYGITQCYLSPDTSELVPSNPSQTGWYSIYLPQRDRRLSWVVDPGDLLHTEMVYPPTDDHPSKY